MAKEVKKPYNVYLNDVLFIVADNLEASAQFALGLHKMSNQPHLIKVVFDSEVIIYLKSE